MFIPFVVAFFPTIKIYYVVSLDSDIIVPELCYKEVVGKSIHLIFYALTVS